VIHAPSIQVSRVSQVGGCQLEPTAIIRRQAVGVGVAGAIVTVIVGLIKNAMASQTAK
jgi:hypothetical protein